MNTDKNLNTPYDDVFRTMLVNCPELIIPVVNEVFGKDYSNEKIVLCQNEVYVNGYGEDGEKRITDSHFTIGKDKYHIECQSTPDGSMIIRMFEYDIRIALQDANADKERIEINIPNSAVLYLRSTKNTPSEYTITINVPGEKSCSYTVPVLKVKEYGIDEIFTKELYFLIPFHIFTYENKFKVYEQDEDKLKELKNTYVGIFDRLRDLMEQEKLTEFEKVIINEMSNTVAKYIAAKFDRLKKGLGDVMGGKVLETEAKNILDAGRREGRNEGLREGIERTVLYYRQIGETDKNIAKLISNIYGITTEEAESYLKA